MKDLIAQQKFLNEKFIKEEDPPVQGGGEEKPPEPQKLKIDIPDTPFEVDIQQVKDQLKKILRVEEKPLVSIDFNGDPFSSIIDSSSTKVMKGNMIKVLAWYDNEWGYSNRVKDLLKFIISKNISG